MIHYYTIYALITTLYWNAMHRLVKSINIYIYKLQICICTKCVHVLVVNRICNLLQYDTSCSIWDNV